MSIGAKQLGSEFVKIDSDGKTSAAIDKDALKKLWENYYVPYVNGYFTAQGRFRSEDEKTGTIIALICSTTGAMYFPTEVTIDDDNTYPIEHMVLPVPNFEGTEPYIVQQGAGMSVLKSDEKSEYASSVFLKWFTEKERNINFSAESGYLPVKKESCNYSEIEKATESSGTQLSDICKDTLRDTQNIDDIIQFNSTGIAEVDQLTDAIQQLQINVKEQSSRVSKIISMSVVGIGAFMYDTVKQTVFISESMILTFNCDKMPPKDTTITYDQFMTLMADIDERNCTNISGFFKSACDGSTKEITTRQYHIITDTGEQKWFRLSLRRDNTNILGLVQDVTQSVLEMKKVKYERDYDVTTGLLNRRAYYNKIEKLFREPEKLKTAAFIMFDIDNLKYVNDTYGHDFGDDYIAATANVLKNFQYSGGIVSRMSGDEFNVFLYGFDSRDEIRKIISDVRERLENSFCILSDGTHYKLRASGGVSWYPDDSTSYEMLIRFADFAMYTIKHSTKGNITEFDMSAYSKDSILITGVEEMNRIIDAESIKYAFQSIISVKTGKVYGYEALMRPQSEVFKAPLDLIRIAKTSARLYQIERLTWKLALRTFHKLMDDNIVPADTKVFVNSISNYVMKEKTSP